MARPYRSRARAVSVAAPCAPALPWLTAVMVVLASLLVVAPLRAAPADKPVKVMIVGVFHMSNPGHDQYNVQVDDVLAGKRQSQIAAVNAGLSRFRPTVVAAEWPEATVKERYAKFLAGTLAPSRNEVVQLAFRLAKSNQARMLGVDVAAISPSTR